MQFSIRLVFCGVLMLAPMAARPQSGTGALDPQNEAAMQASAFSQLPDEPMPQDRDLAEAPGQQQDPVTKPAESSSAEGNGQNGTQAPAAQSSTEKSQHDKAEEELK